MHFVKVTGLASVVTVLCDPAPKKDDHELHFIPLGENAKSGRGKQEHHPQGIMPLSQFTKLFPFDIPAGAHVRVIHINPDAQPDMIGNMLGDSILDRIMSEISGGFHNGLKPLIAQARNMGSSTPHPCIADTKKFCEEDHDHSHEHFSRLHCLGLHASELSTDCAKEVESSLPFLCSGDISRFCGPEETINRSVLQCLETNKESVREVCKDSIEATRSVIQRINTQEVNLVNRKTGQVIKSSKDLIYTATSVMFYGMQ